MRVLLVYEFGWCAFLSLWVECFLSRLVLLAVDSLRDLVFGVARTVD